MCTCISWVLPVPRSSVMRTKAVTIPSESLEAFFKLLHISVRGFGVGVWCGVILEPSTMMDIISTIPYMPTESILSILSHALWQDPGLFFHSHDTHLQRNTLEKGHGWDDPVFPGSTKPAVRCWGSVKSGCYSILHYCHYSTLHTLN